MKTTSKTAENRNLKMEKLLQLHPKTLSSRGLSMLSDASGLGWANFDVSIEKQFSQLFADAVGILFELVIIDELY